MLILKVAISGKDRKELLRNLCVLALEIGGSNNGVNGLMGYDKRVDHLYPFEEVIPYEFDWIISEKTKNNLVEF
jgi:hypothetical protein